MSSRRERDTDRDRRGTASSGPRRTDFYHSQDGIDREVITADICRYLGNDALVRPSKVINSLTGQPQAVYIVTAYRDLTSAMIADLKADSERWEAERRQTASRGQSSNVGYTASRIHDDRQYYGPSRESDRGQSSSEYPSSGSTGTPSGNPYDAPGYQQQNSYAQPAPGYPPSTGYPTQDNYYVAGANLERLEPERSTRVPVTSASVPRNTYASSSTATYQQPPDSRYYSVPTPVTQAQQVYTPQDPYYGREASYPSQDAYDSRSYQESGYSQASSSSSIPAPANSSSRRERDRDPERDSRSHRHGRR